LTARSDTDHTHAANCRCERCTTRRRATADLRADHQPRTLQHEPRLCRADEQTIADDVRQRESKRKQAARTATAATTSDIAARVQTLRDALHSDLTTSRGERNLARRIAHDLDVLTGMLESPSNRGVHSGGRV
jgi:hypothetical protein